MDEEKHFHEQATVNLSVAFFLSLLFNIVVIIGGFYTNSVAILADALHDLSDTLAIFLAWLLEKLSLKKPTENYTYGYKRFSIFGALITSVIVICGSTLVIYESVIRLFTVVSPDAEGLVIVAVLGILFKGVSVLKLHHGHTLNERAILVHLLGDIFEWIAVLIMSIVLIFVDLPILDPLISILISIWIIYNLAKTLISSFKILLQRSPSSIELTSLKEDILKVNNVDSIEDIHLWTVDGIEHILTLKVITHTKKANDLNQIKSDLGFVKSEYNINDITLEFIIE